MDRFDQAAAPVPQPLACVPPAIADVLPCRSAPVVRAARRSRALLCGASLVMVGAMTPASAQDLQELRRGDGRRSRGNLLRRLGGALRVRCLAVGGGRILLRRLQSLLHLLQPRLVVALQLLQLRIVLSLEVLHLAAQLLEVLRGRGRHGPDHH